jgi:hypothetical protein
MIDGRGHAPIVPNLKRFKSRAALAEAAEPLTFSMRTEDTAVRGGKRQVGLFLITLPPGHPVLLSSLHHRALHGIDIHAVLESLFCGSTHPPSAPLGPVVVPGCQAHSDNNYSPDDAQKDHFSPDYLRHFE